MKQISERKRMFLLLLYNKCTRPKYCGLSKHRETHRFLFCSRQLVILFGTVIENSKIGIFYSRFNDLFFCYCTTSQSDADAIRSRGNSRFVLVIKIAYHSRACMLRCPYECYQMLQIYKRPPPSFIVQVCLELPGQYPTPIE